VLGSARTGTRRVQVRDGAAAAAADDDAAADADADADAAIDAAADATIDVDAIGVFVETRCRHARTPCPTHDLDPSVPPPAQTVFVAVHTGTSHSQ